MTETCITAATMAAENTMPARLAVSSSSRSTGSSCASCCSQRLAHTWGQRARVKQRQLDDATLFDHSKDDFLPSLLPFGDHPAFLAASTGMQKLILSCGWLAYNEKTVDIEAKMSPPPVRTSSMAKYQDCETA